MGFKSMEICTFRSSFILTVAFNTCMSKLRTDFEFLHLIASRYR